MDLKTLGLAIIEIAEKRGIPKEKVVEVISDAIASAYKKEYGKKKEKIIANFDVNTGKLKFWQVKLVVPKDMLLSEKEIESLKEKKASKKQLAGESETETKIRFNPDRHILLEEAKKIKPKIKPGEEIKIALETKKDFGRIATQTAKQVILQKIKEVEKEEIFKEYKEKEGEVVSGIVQRIEPSAVFLDIGRTSGILPKKEQIPGEHYRVGQRLKLYVLEAQFTPKGAQILLSRIYPKFVSKLFELEVPEISAGQVVIKSIAREAGSRTKIAVAQTEEGIDPVGSLIGQRGTRILVVTNELNGEKIDIIEWDEKPEIYIANALSPAKVLEVKIMPKNKALVTVPQDQLSLAIGKNGQNVRLAAKLTGWKIDVSPIGNSQPAAETNEANKDSKNEEETDSTSDSSNSKEG
ncbi:transcription termination/antitermination protein NusA [bacterium]|nr:transcription termination/antitermination protein NusA [bacterium]